MKHLNMSRRIAIYCRRNTIRFFDRCFYNKVTKDLCFSEASFRIRTWVRAYIGYLAT